MYLLYIGVAILLFLSVVSYKLNRTKTCEEKEKLKLL